MFIYENQAPIFRQHPHDSWRLYLWDRLAHSLVQGSVQKITISLMVVLHCTCSQFKSQLYINSFFICDVTSEFLSMLPFLVGCKNVIHCEAWPLCVQFSLTSGPDQELLEEKKKNPWETCHWFSGVLNDFWFLQSACYHALLRVPSILSRVFRYIQWGDRVESRYPILTGTRAVDDFLSSWLSLSKDAWSRL